MEELDQDVVRLAKAIRTKESGGDFNAVGDNKTSKGAYQWQAKTWKSHAKDILGDENATMTKETQNRVAYGVIKKLKDNGKNPAQIAAIWNSGTDKNWENKVGFNKKIGVAYDVPKYVNVVTKIYQDLKNEEGLDIPRQVIQEERSVPLLSDLFANESQGIEDARQSRISQGLPVGTYGRVEPTIGGDIVRGLTRPIVQAASEVLNLPSTITGGLIPETTFQSEYFGEVPSFKQSLDRRAKKEAEAINEGEQGYGKALLKTTGEAAMQALNVAGVIPTIGLTENLATRLAGKAVPSFGKALKTSLIRGGGEAALYNTSQQIAEKGSVDPRELAVNVAAGTAFDVGLTKVLPDAINSIRKTPNLKSVYTGSYSQKAQSEAVNAYEEALRTGAYKYEGTRKILAKLESRGGTPLKTLAETGYMPERQGDKFIFTKVIDDLSDDIGELYENVDPYLRAFDDKVTDSRALEGNILNEMRKSGDFAATINEDTNRLSKLFNNFRETYGEVFTPAVLNKISKQANKLTKAYDNPSELLSNDIANVVGRVSNKYVDNLIDDKIVRDINKRAGKLIEARKVATKLDGKMFGGGVMTRKLSQIVGAVVGSNSGLPIAGPLLGALGGDNFVSMLKTLEFTNPLRTRILKSLKIDTKLQQELVSKLPKAEQEYVKRVLKATLEMKKEKIKIGLKETSDKIKIQLPEGRKGQPQSQNFVAQIKLGKSMVEKAPSKIRMTKSEYNQSQLEKAIRSSDAVNFENKADEQSFIKFALENLPQKTPYQITESTMERMYSQYAKTLNKIDIKIDKKNSNQPFKETVLQSDMQEYIRKNLTEDELMALGVPPSHYKEMMLQHGDNKLLNQMLQTRGRLKDGEYLDTETKVKTKNGYKKSKFFTNLGNKRSDLIQRITQTRTIGSPSSRGGKVFDVDHEDGSVVNQMLDDFENAKEDYADAVNLQNKYNQVKRDFRNTRKETKRIVSEEAYQKAVKNFKENSKSLNAGIPIDSSKKLEIADEYVADIEHSTKQKDIKDVDKLLKDVEAKKKESPDVPEVKKYEVLPKDITVLQEAKVMGAKRISPDRITHQQMTPEEGIKKVDESLVKNASKVSDSWIRGRDRLTSIIETGKNDKTLVTENDRDYIKSLMKQTKTKTTASLSEKIDDIIKSTTPSKEDLNSLHNKAKDTYVKLVKDDISKGYRFPEEVLSFDPSFKKAITSRERFEKGLKTSFSSDDSRIVFDKDTGTGMKRQDGKELTETQKNEILSGIKEVKGTLGIDLDRLAKDEKWVIVHLNGKNPFLMKDTAGLYRKSGDNISVSVGGLEKFDTVIDGKRVSQTVNTTIAHELGHALDNKVGKKMFNWETLFKLKTKDKYNPLENNRGSTKYWSSNAEISARMVEQYIAIKKGHTGYFDKPAYWKKDIFENTIKPEIENAIKRHYSEYLIK